ncbi:MAG: flagellar hook-length control protein FliK [Hahellaceae bacterium]|nr:flagellar hook-length control protein FliK [Hahellaceae bacterium]
MNPLSLNLAAAPIKPNTQTLSVGTENIARKKPNDKAAEPDKPSSARFDDVMKSQSEKMAAKKADKQRSSNEDQKAADQTKPDKEVSTASETLEARDDNLGKVAKTPEAEAAKDENVIAENGEKLPVEQGAATPFDLTMLMPFDEGEAAGASNIDLSEFDIDGFSDDSDSGIDADGAILSLTADGLPVENAVSSEVIAVNLPVNNYAPMMGRMKNAESTINNNASTIFADGESGGRSIGSGSLGLSALGLSTSMSEMPVDGLSAEAADADLSFSTEFSKLLGSDSAADSLSGTAGDERMITGGGNPALRMPELNLRGTPGLQEYTTSVDTQVGDAEWQGEVSEKVVWLVSRQIQSAEIHLNPAELGPIQVSVHMHNDQAQVSFTAHHPQVRDLIEQNVSRLREMLNDNGVNLSDVNVSDQNAQGRDSERQAEAAGQRWGGEANADDADLEIVEAQVTSISSDQLIDLKV